MSESAAATPAEFRKMLWLGVLGANALALLLATALYIQATRAGVPISTTPANNLLLISLIGLAAFMLTSFFLARRLLHAWTTQAATLTRLQATTQHLQENERHWRKLFDQSSLGAAIMTPEGAFLNVNAAICRMLGHPRDALMALNIDQIMHPEELPRELAQMQHMLAGESEQCAGECRMLAHDGQVVWTHITMNLVRDGAGQPLYFLPMIEDIGSRKAAEERINHLAYHDALTGLPNRQLAKDRLDHAIAYAAREKNGVGVLHLDLDHFKAVNDSLGHPIGDALIQEVAKKLENCVRDTDTIARIGGDEFLIILANVMDPEIISSIAVKVQETLGTTFKVQGHELTTSVSIGITVYPGDGKDFDMLLKKADTALYKAKAHGRNTYQFYTDQMNSEAVEYLKIRNGLRQALINEEFLLHYQPQINLADGKVVGVEALIRWRHPEMGILQPGRFIQIAEESGLIVPIGDWALKHACQQAVAWRQAGLPPVVVAVNLSAVQFKRGDIEKSVIQALNESGHDPNYLELELTESILIDDTDHALETLRRLKAMGMKLSIDDFGTGYSSLSYLKRFNVDKLKIDQSFVRDMANDKNDAAIVQAIIQMARSLNLQVIAEGVEDERLVALLHGQQCHEAQGYHFARPMAPAAFIDYMTAMGCAAGGALH
ncbi:MAG: EAL domain-containing protein [Sterolibacterium sp.]|nr:EAL domain-containing protein [Sterolibacterium sp.]